MKEVYAGDSISRPDNQDRAFYPYLFAAISGTELLNLAVGGQGVAEQTDAILGHPPVSGENYNINLGSCDRDARGATEGALTLFALVYKALLAWWTTDKKLLSDSSWTLTGTWQAFTNPSWGWSKFTSTNGATASNTCSGPMVEIAYLLVPGDGSGSFYVTVDEVTYGPFSTAPTATIPVLSTRFYAPALLQIPVSEGSHNVTVTQVSGTVFLLWLGQGSNGRPLYAFMLPNHGDPAVQAQVDAYNAVIEAAAEGVAIVVDAKLVPSQDLLPGGDIHPNASGQCKYAAAKVAAQLT